MATIRLGEIAYARSGDKGAGANVGVIARSARAFEFLKANLTAARVETYFAQLNPGRAVRYELPNLLALNFVVPEILDGGGSVSLRIDAQGKALGQAILEMRLDLPDALRIDLLSDQRNEPAQKDVVQESEKSSLRIANDDPAILVLKLNRPQKRNALRMDLIERLCQAVNAASEDPARRVILLCAEGPAFCAGLDLHEASQAGGAERAAEALARLYSAIVSSPLITIAAAQGAAMGGGVGLLAACDLVVASEDLQIALPEVRRGLIPALVCCLLRRQLQDRSLREMILLTKTVDASQALKLGLVNRVVPQNQLLKTSLAMAVEASLGAPDAIAQTKKLLNESGAHPFTEEIIRAFAYHRNAQNSAEAQEGIAAFLGKRAPRWGLRSLLSESEEK